MSNDAEALIEYRGRMMTETEVRNEKELAVQWKQQMQADRDETATKAEKRAAIAAERAAEQRAAYARALEHAASEEEFSEAGEPKQRTAAEQSRHLADSLINNSPLTDDQAIALAQVYALLALTDVISTHTGQATQA